MPQSAQDDIFDNLIGILKAALAQVKAEKPPFRAWHLQATLLLAMYEEKNDHDAFDQ